MQKFRQSSIVFEKPGFLSEKLKTLTSSNYYRVQYFLLTLCTRFLLTNVYKRVFRIFSILLRLELFAKIIKHSFFTFLLITQDSIFQTSSLVLGNNRALSKFRYRILHNLISTTELTP